MLLLGLPQLCLKLPFCRINVCTKKIITIIIYVNGARTSVLGKGHHGYDRVLGDSERKNRSCSPDHDRSGVRAKTTASCWIGNKPEPNTTHTSCAVQTTFEAAVPRFSAPEQRSRSHLRRVDRQWLPEPELQVEPAGSDSDGWDTKLPLHTDSPRSVVSVTVALRKLAFSWLNYLHDMCICCRLA